MRFALAVLAFGLPVAAMAQVQNPYSPPAGGYPQPYPAQQPGYPQQYQQPQQQYPSPQQPYGQQAYPQQGYPPPSSYPYYPPPRAAQTAQQPGPAQPSATPPPAPPAHLTLATRSQEVATLVTTCANAIDNEHFAAARKSCGQAIEKEDTLAFSHYLLAQAVAPDVALKELTRAAELAKRASNGERLFIESYRAMVQG